MLLLILFQTLETRVFESTGFPTLCDLSANIEVSTLTALLANQVEVCQYLNLSAQRSVVAQFSFERQKQLGNREISLNNIFRQCVRHGYNISWREKNEKHSGLIGDTSLKMSTIHRSSDY